MSSNKLIPPAVRFIRAFDVSNRKMVNVWMRLTTQAQIDACPNCSELTVTAQTVEKAIEEMKNMWKNYFSHEEQELIIQSSARLEPCNEPVYYP